MNITQLVFSWPKEAQYSCEPEDYDDWDIEDYALEMGTTPLKLGDVRTWENRLWQVATLEQYHADTAPENACAVAVLTLDGSIPTREQTETPAVMVVYLSPNDFNFAWPLHPDAMPQIGSDAPDLEGWQVNVIQGFQGDGETSTYEQILVCWCAAVSTLQTDAIAA
jgi:hypothetical protein